jgi:hypothetical protein
MASSMMIVAVNLHGWWVFSVTLGFPPEKVGNPAAVGFSFSPMPSSVHFFRAEVFS